MIDKTVKVFRAKDKRAVIQLQPTQRKWLYEKLKNDLLKCVTGLKSKNNLPPDWNHNDENIVAELSTWIGSFDNGGYYLDPYYDAVFVKLKKCCDKLGFPFKDIWPFEIDSHEPTALETKLHMDEYRRAKKQHELSQQGVENSNFNQLFE